MSRSEAREIAFKLIFEYDFAKMKQVETFEEFSVGLGEDDLSYLNEVYNGVCANYDKLLEDIAENANGFEVSRIYKVDLAILILAIYEIKYMSSIPYKVSVDEALNLAEKYSTEKSSKYINGILSKFSK